MATSSTFYQLSYADQASLLSSEGTYLQTRTEGNFVIDLYELHDLLIELFFLKETEEPVSVMAYNTSEKLRTLSGRNLQPRLTIKQPNTIYRNESYAA